MEHLTYEDYKVFGGQCNNKDFPVLLLDAETTLQFLTDNRIDEIILTPKEKRCIVKIIDEIFIPKKQFMDVRKGIASYSDGIESISYNADYFTDSAINNRVSNICMQYLDNWLVYRGVVRR